MAKDHEAVTITELGTEPLGEGQQLVYSHVQVRPDPDDLEVEMDFLDIRERNTATGVLGDGLLLPIAVWDVVMARVDKEGW